MWWPFAKRGTRIEVPVKLDLPVHLPEDLSVFGRNNACIKLWLPEKLITGLDVLSGSTEQSRPDVLRWLLFEHVYGRPAFETLKAWKKSEDEAARQREEAMVDLGVKRSPSRRVGVPDEPFVAERPYTAKLLGKSVEDFKLWIPGIIKIELQKLAQFEKLALSDYLRKTLIRQLLGESFHHQWRSVIGKLPEEVLLFENTVEI